MVPLSVDGTDVSDITIDGSDVSEVTMGGDVVWLSVEAPSSGVTRITFDDADTESGTALDVWDGNDMTINGATAGQPGLATTYDSGESYDFDGTADSGDFDVPLIDATTGNAFSLVFWLRLDQTHSFGRAVNQNDNTNGFVLADNGGDLVVRFENNDATNQSTIRSLSTGTAYHICVTRDSSDNWTAYVNATEENTGAGATGGEPYNTRVMGRNDGTEFVEGGMDALDTYDKELSASEVSNHYNTGSIGG